MEAAEPARGKRGKILNVGHSRTAVTDDLIDQSMPPENLCNSVDTQGSNRCCRTVDLKTCFGPGEERRDDEMIRERLIGQRVP